jgi:hypothetical protein
MAYKFTVNKNYFLVTSRFHFENCRYVILLWLMVWLTTFIAFMFGQCGFVKVVGFFHPSSMINLMGRSHSKRFY